MLNPFINQIVKRCTESSSVSYRSGCEGHIRNLLVDPTSNDAQATFATFLEDTGNDYYVLIHARGRRVHHAQVLSFFLWLPS